MYNNNSISLWSAKVPPQLNKDKNKIQIFVLRLVSLSMILIYWQKNFATIISAILRCIKRTIVHFISLWVN